MKAKELRDLNLAELQGKEKDLSQQLFNLRFQKSTGQLGNSAMIGKTRKEIARIKTVIRAMKAH
ncbi:MAG: 50S ribosomal protein L29 [Desulfobacteraceae bacterium]|nr:MAG: 50S ribosomal protein L29 [Desulfobacteraceae bacterium]